MGNIEIWGFWLTAIGTIVAVIVAIKADLVPAIWRKWRIEFPYFPLSIFLSTIGVFIIGATAIMHWEDDTFPKPFSMVSYACFLCAIALGYSIIAAIRFGRINILAWQGWELLDNHIGALSGWPGTRFRALYYFRGIDSTTELYDKNRDPFNIMILDAEQIAAIDDQTKDSIAPFPESYETDQPELLKRILEENIDRFPKNKLKFGVPVRFGFNEILYTKGLAGHFLANGEELSMSMIALGNLYKWADEKNVRLRIMFWDWSLPTLTLLLCAYEAAGGPAASPLGRHSLKDVYRLDADAVRKTSTAIVQDLKRFNEYDAKKGYKTHRAYKVSRIEELQALLDVREHDMHDIIIGFGSMATSGNEKELFNLIPREGVLTWVEFAAVIKGKGQDKAKSAISDVILSLATQIRLTKRHAPRGLPANREAFLHCAKQRSVPRMMTTALELDREPTVPLVMRRLPGTSKTASTPQDAAIREVWEEAWAKIRRELDPFDADTARHAA